MSSKAKNHKKNLFTLNQSLKLDDNLRSDQSSIDDDPNQIDFDCCDQNQYKEQIQKLIQDMEQMKKINNQLKLKNKQLKDGLDISQLRNAKHQEKQRQLIKKLSHQQISNKQLQFQIRKANQQIIRIKENNRFADHRNVQVSNSLRKAQQERSLFIQCFKKVAQAITKCQKVEQFQSCIGKFLDFIKKNLRNYEQSDPNTQFQFQLKFQLGQISSLKTKNSELQAKILKLKQDIQKQKLDKKRIITTFNQKIKKLKQQCDDLKSKVDQKDNEAQYQINTLKKALTQKNQMITELKYKIDSEKKKKDSVCSRKSRIKKRSYYISDGQRQQGQMQMSELQNQIQHLERLIIQELKQ